MRVSFNSNIIVPLLATVYFGVECGQAKAQNAGSQDPANKQANKHTAQEFASFQDGLLPRPFLDFPNEMYLSPNNDSSQHSSKIVRVESLDTSKGLLEKPHISEESQAEPASAHPLQEVETGNVWNGLAHNIPAPAVWLAAYSVAVLSVLAALRGVVKGYIEVRAWKSKMNRIKKWNLTDSFQLEYLSLQRNGELKLRSVTRNAIKLNDVLKTGGADDIFIKAAARCTEKQPFPFLNLPYEREGYILFKRDNGRLQYLRRIQEDIIKYVQGIYHNSPYGQAEGMQLYHNKEEKIETRQMVIIPVCDVDRVGKTTSRKLILYTISQSDFDEIRKAPELKVEQGTDPGVLEYVRAAINIIDKSHAQRIFPIANIYVKRAKQSLPRIIPKLDAASEISAEPVVLS